MKTRRGKDHEIPIGSTAGRAHNLRTKPTAIQTGGASDTHDWLLYI